MSERRWWPARSARVPSASPTSAPTARRSMCRSIAREREAAALGQRRVRLQALEPLAQRGRRRVAPHERAASLPADDLAALLQAMQRAAQRPARDAQHRGDLVLGREPVALPVAATRQPDVQGLLGAVDQGWGALVRRAALARRPCPSPSWRHILAGHLVALLPTQSLDILCQEVQTAAPTAPTRGGREPLLDYRTARSFSRARARGRRAPVVPVGSIPRPPAPRSG